MKLFRYISFEKYINILALKMASPGNRHCANCIGTLSFPVKCSTTFCTDIVTFTHERTVVIVFILGELSSPHRIAYSQSAKDITYKTRPACR